MMLLYNETPTIYDVAKRFDKDDEWIRDARLVIAKSGNSDKPYLKEVLSVRRYKKFGYEIRTELIDGEHFGGEDFTVKSAYTIEDGLYIGDPRTAHFLCAKKGIKPEISQKDHNVCSIGFRKSDQKWYGWSHRAIAGFGIGDKLFEEKFGTDNTLFTQHGRKTIKTLEEAKLSAKRFALSVS